MVSDTHWIYSSQNPNTKHHESQKFHTRCPRDGVTKLLTYFSITQYKTSYNPYASLPPRVVHTYSPWFSHLIGVPWHSSPWRWTSPSAWRPRTWLPLNWHIRTTKSWDMEKQPGWIPIGDNYWDMFIYVQWFGIFISWNIYINGNLIGVASGHQTGKSGKSPNLLYAGLNRKINDQLGGLSRTPWLITGGYLFLWIVLYNNYWDVNIYIYICIQLLEDLLIEILPLIVIGSDRVFMLSSIQNHCWLMIVGDYTN